METVALMDRKLLPPFIGQYRVLGKLGEGGVGEVYLCEQIQPIRRRVAVKVIKPGMHSDAVVRRFRSERELLALMHHPSIARLLDAGETDRGLPFFVLEYVPGLQLIEYCRDRRLRLRARLELFMRVCAAVQHAHQKSVAHHDLKPTNILVVDVDGVPQPKIIDFGTSRALYRKHDGNTEDFVGSPEYMSPEQSLLDAAASDTRSDIYSLGVLLYELLAGCTPIRLPQSAYTLNELQRTLRDTAILPPSARVLQLNEREHLSQLGRRTARELAWLLAGDLDCIVLKALAFEPAQRYATAAELAADLQRFLQHEPVMAARPSRLYAIRKFARRHAFPVFAATSAALLLIAFTGFSVWQAHALREERDRANRETVKANEVTDFMVKLFALGDPHSGYGPSVTVRQAVDLGAQRIGSALEHQPGVQSELMLGIGRVYLNMGLTAEAAHIADEALARIPATDVAQRAAALLVKAQAFRQLERPAESEAVYQEALQLLTSAAPRLAGMWPRSKEWLPRFGFFISSDSPVAGGSNPVHTNLLASTRFGLAQLAKDAGDLKQSSRLFNDVMAMLEQEGATDTVIYAKTLNEVGQDAFYQGDIDRAETQVRQAMETMNRALGPAALETAATRGWLMHILGQQSRHAEAEALGRENLRVLVQVYGEDHEIVARAYNNLAIVLDNNHDDDEAETLYQRALEWFERHKGSDSAATLRVLENLAAMYLNAGRFADAEPRYRRIVEALDGVASEDSVRIADARWGLAYSLGQLGRAEEAMKQVDAAWQPYLEHFGENTWPMAYAYEVRGIALLALGRNAEARSDLEHARRVYVAQLGSDSDWIARIDATMSRLETERRPARSKDFVCIDNALVSFEEFQVLDCRGRVFRAGSIPFELEP